MDDSSRTCSNPGCDNKGKHLCSACGEEKYCTKECQKAHWGAHKLACKSAVKPEAAALLKSFDSLSSKQLKNIISAKAATMDPKPKHTLLNKLEKIVEKAELVKVARDNVSLSEVEALLSGEAKKANVAAGGVPVARPSRRSGTRMVAQQENPTGTPSPDQLRQQAAMMRKNPDMVRKANPAFANMTNQQIFEYANHMEQTASDPDMMKEVLKMSKLTNNERTDLQSIQEGLSGIKPCDDAWIAKTIKTLKTKPELFKNLFKGKGQMFGGVSDEQIDSFIDGASKLDAYWLNLIFKGIRFLVSLYKPTVQLYQTLDSYTFGFARYIVIGLVIVAVFFIAKISWVVTRFFFGKLSTVVMYMWSMLNGSSSSSAAGGSSAASYAASSSASSLSSSSSTAAAASKVAENVAAAGASMAAGAVAAGAGNNGAETKAATAAAANSNHGGAESIDDEFEF